MARVEGYFDFVLCYKTELKRVVRGHHVYQSVWTSTVGENLFTAPDKREEALSYDEFAIGVYKDEKCSLLVGHLPIEISSLSYHFLKKSSENKIIYVFLLFHSLICPITSFTCACAKDT